MWKPRGTKRLRWGMFGTPEYTKGIVAYATLRENLGGTHIVPCINIFRLEEGKSSAEVVETRGGGYALKIDGHDMSFLQAIIDKEESQILPVSFALPGTGGIRFKVERKGRGLCLKSMGALMWGL